MSRVPVHGKATGHTSSSQDNVRAPAEVGKSVESYIGIPIPFKLAERCAEPHRVVARYWDSDEAVDDILRAP